MTYIFTEKVRKNIALLVIHCAPLKVTLCKLWHQLLMSHLICPSVDKALIVWNETLLPTGYQSPSLGACSRSMCPEPCCWGEDHPLPWSVEAGCPVLVQSTGAPTPAPSQPAWPCPFPWGRVNHHIGASILTPCTFLSNSLLTPEAFAGGKFKTSSQGDAQSSRIKACG